MSPSTGGGVTQYAVEVAGVQSDGIALAGKAAVTEPADMSRQKLVDDIIDGLAPDLMRDYFKTSVIHRLNKDELASRVADRKHAKGVSSEEAWAWLLNTAVRSSFKRVAYKHLVQRKAEPFRLLDTAVVSLTAGSLAADIVQHNTVRGAAMLGTIGVVNAAIVFADSRGNKALYGDTCLRERRWTVMPYGGWQPDRFLAVAALTHLQPLISYRK